jgi:hypothetical protein
MEHIINIGASKQSEVARRKIQNAAKPAEDIFNKISGEYSPQKFNKTKTNFANPPSDLKPEQGLAKLVGCTILPKTSVLVYWQDNSVPFFTFSLCFHKK